MRFIGLKKVNLDFFIINVKRKLDENEASTVAQLIFAGENSRPPVSSKKLKLDTTNVDLSAHDSTPISSKFVDRSSFIIKANNDRKVKHKSSLKRQVKKFNEGFLSLLVSVNNCI